MEDSYDQKTIIFCINEKMADFEIYDVEVLGPGDDEGNIAILPLEVEDEW